MNFVQTQLDGGVLTLTLADDDNRNALGDGLRSQLHAAIQQADADPQVRVVVLTHTGNTFCAGADLKRKAAGGDAPAAAGFPDILQAIRHSPKPYVGRIAGHCMAGGVGLAAVLDISVAAEDAMFGFTEVRLGVAPAIISVVCLPKMQGAQARDAFLRGNRFDARQAQRMGLINHAVPPDALDTTVREVVRDLIAGGPQALAVTKQLLREVPQMGFAAALDWAAPLSAGLFAGEEGQEGMAARREKRKARWNTNTD